MEAACLKALELRAAIAAERQESLGLPHHQDLLTVGEGHDVMTESVISWR